MWASKASAPAEAFGVFWGGSKISNNPHLPTSTPIVPPLYTSALHPSLSGVGKLFLGQSEKKFGLLAGNLYL
jgi:hypothetical protein